MALWILNRPADLGDSTELRVADLLARLPDDWVIRWGFHYQDNAGHTREGDFLVLGPSGGLLVIEVKSDLLHHYAPTGRWENPEGDHPLIQLDAEWKAVLRVTNAHRNRRPSLYVARALALPHLDIARQVSEYHGIPRDLVLSAGELGSFEQAWRKRMQRPGIHLDAASRAIFFDTYGAEATPQALHHFVTESDRALVRLTEANFELLDQLAGNRQFVVRGGPGTGKTWLALELARQWAEIGATGSRVLFLAYNLALSDYLRELVKRMQQRGRLADAPPAFGPRLRTHRFQRRGMNLTRDDPYPAQPVGMKSAELFCRHALNLERGHCRMNAFKAILEVEDF